MTPELSAVDVDGRDSLTHIRLLLTVEKAFKVKNGMISVIICRPGEPETWEIDTWLMSCRVLGRRVEHMVLREIIEHARTTGIRKLAGTYRPTDRNKLVVDHYAKLGFTKILEEESGLTRWELPVDGATPESGPMKVVSHGFAAAAESSLV